MDGSQRGLRKEKGDGGCRTGGSGGRPADSSMILFIGRLAIQKGPDLLLDGVPRVLS